MYVTDNYSYKQGTVFDITDSTLCQSLVSRHVIPIMFIISCESHEMINYMQISLRLYVYAH
jgi:hypothetical protein